MEILLDFYNYIKESNLSKNNEIIFLLNEKYFQETDNIKIDTSIKKNWINRLKFDLFTGRRYINSLKPDIVISLQNTIVFGVKCKQILYVQQAIPFQKEKTFSLFKKKERKLAIIQKFIGYIIQKSIQKSDLIVVQTEWMRKKIIKKTHISPKKIIRIIPNIKIEENNTKVELNRKSFFYPASNNLYKNHDCIYKACNILKRKGITEYSVDLTIQKEKNNVDNINYVGYLTHGEVLEKYKNSILIFPSYIETIGLPLLEAKAAKTIILVSDCEYAREILEGYENVYFFNPFEPEELANLMEAVLQNKIKMNSCSHQNGLVKDSWEKLFLNI